MNNLGLLFRVGIFSAVVAGLFCLANCRLNENNPLLSENEETFGEEIRISREIDQNWEISVVLTPKNTKLTTLIGNIQPIFADGSVSGERRLLRLVDEPYSWEIKDDPRSDLSSSKGIFRQGEAFWRIRNSTSAGRTVVERSDDSGASWEEMLKMEHGVIFDMCIADKGSGYAVGNEVVSEAPLETKLAVFKTSNFGYTWNQLKIERDRFYKGEVVDRIDCTSQNRFKVLTTSKRIFDFSEADPTPKFVFEIEGEPAQTHFRKIETNQNGDSLLLGTAESIEGSWTVIVSASRSVVRYRTNDFILTQMRRTEGSGYLFVGHTASDFVSDKPQNGVIMYSEDNGKNLRMLYESETTEKYIGIFEDGISAFLVVGNDGSVVRIKNSSDS